MQMRVAAATVVITVAGLLAPAASGQRQPEPIIDMHMHALAADEQGPPPLGMCPPLPELRARHAAGKLEFHNNAARFLRLPAVQR